MTGDRPGRIAEAGPGLGVECPSVQGTVNLAVIEYPRSQGAAAMRAVIIQGEELPVDIPHRKLAASDFDGPSLTGSETGSVGDGDEVLHGWVGDGVLEWVDGVEVAAL